MLFGKHIIVEFQSIICFMKIVDISTLYRPRELDQYKLLCSVRVVRAIYIFV